MPFHVAEQMPRENPEVGLVNKTGRSGNTRRGRSRGELPKVIATRFLQKPPASRRRYGYLMTRTLAVDVNCFCTPAFMKFAVNVSGTARPAGTLLSISALLNVATNV